MIYKSSQALKGKTLEHGDVVHIGTHRFSVMDSYLHDQTAGYSSIFREEPFKKAIPNSNAFALDQYGYEPDGGDFPDCHSGDYEALTRIALALLLIYEGKSIPKKSKKKASFKELDKLVIAPEVKEEIVSILRQHDNSIKIFEEWGLGELITYGRGMTFMFYGNPGTGKTYAATLIAKALGKELLTIGAAEIQTSEPGGANRNIQNAFKSAKEGKGKILFIDECDSLITSRQNVGMIIGGEINTLLTEIEKFEGVCILATNRISFMDEALHRRIALIVDFPEPDFAMRKEIWTKLLPSKMPLATNVSIEKLAEYNLTGGLIKNAILQAARFAASSNAKKVELKHFTQAIDRANKTKNLMGTDLRLKGRIEAVSDYKVDRG